VGHQLVHSGALLGTDREDLAGHAQLAGRGEPGDRARRVEAVDLVDGGHGREARVGHRAGDEAVARTDGLVGGEHEEHGVGVGERVLDALLHALGHRIARALDAREVDQHQLPVVAGGDSADLATRGLRLVGHDRHLVAHDPVHQRRLAGVRAAGERDEPGLHRSSAITRSWSASISPPSASWS
jgi:hypothetical protein